MTISKLLFFIIVFLVLGYIFYKLKHWEFTDNSKYIINLLFEELNNIHYNLKTGTLSEFEKKALIKRKNEIYLILEKFFGKNLSTQENELV